jgi:hypothetical protein
MVLVQWHDCLCWKQAQPMLAVAQHNQWIGEDFEGIKNTASTGRLPRAGFTNDQHIFARDTTSTSIRTSKTTELRGH